MWSGSCWQVRVVAAAGWLVRGPLMQATGEPPSPPHRAIGLAACTVCYSNPLVTVQYARSRSDLWLPRKTAVSSSITKKISNLAKRFKSELTQIKSTFLKSAAMGGGFSSQQPKAAAASTMRLHMEANREKTNLSTVKCFVLDNSIRESTTGISRGHTLADRLAIAEAISGCGFKDVVCGYFGTSRKVDDALPEAWVKNGGSLDSLWGFAWYHGGLGDRGIPLPDPCSGLVEMAQTHKIPNAIIEVECNAPSMPYETFDLAEHVERQIRWAMENLPRRAEGALPPRTMIIFGDMGYDRRSAGGMARALEVILEIGRMDPAVRPMGVLCKEPTGFELPESW